MEYQSVTWAKRYVPIAPILLKSLQQSNWLAEQLAEKLEIQADSRAEAVDFVKQMLLDIIEEQDALKTGCIKTTAQKIAELRK